MPQSKPQSCPHERREVVDRALTELLAPVGVLHDEAARLAERAVLRVQRGTERAAAVARRRLNEDLANRRLAR